MHTRIPMRLLLGALLALPLIAAGAHPALALPTNPDTTPGRYTGVPPGPPPTITYADPALTSLNGVWLGQVSQWANLRTGPGVTYPVDRAWPAGRRVLVYGTAIAANGQLWYQVSHYPQPDLYIHSSLVRYVAPLQVPYYNYGATRRDGRWIDVNLTQQILIAYEGAQPVLLAQTASGTTGHETPTGVWHIYWRLAQQDMSNANDKASSSRYYNLKDVPWVQYFQESGDALHGTYWHDNFGTPMSHGCVNLSDWNALWLYNWATLGTPVVVHY